MNTSLKKSIMRRVYSIWALRKVTSPAAVKFYIVIAALWQIGRLVWVAKVFANAPAVTNVPALAQFSLSAFENTQLTVQILVLSVVLLGVWLLKDLFTGRQREPALYFQRS